MDRREELIQLSSQIINGYMSSDNTLISKLYDRTFHSGIAKVTVELAENILSEIDKRTNF